MVVGGGRAVVVVVVVVVVVALCENELIIGDRNMEFTRLKKRSSKNIVEKNQWKLSKNSFRKNSKVACCHQQLLPLVRIYY